MNWEAVGAVGEMAGAIGVIVTLVYLALQIRSNAKATESAVLTNLSTEMERVAGAVATDEALAEALNTARRGDTLNELQSTRLRSWFSAYLRVCESHVLQRHLGATAIDLETPIGNILRLYAATEFCRDVMKNVVDRQLATSQFLKWLDSDVLSTARMHAESQTDR